MENSKFSSISKPYQQSICTDANSSFASSVSSKSELLKISSSPNTDHYFDHYIENEKESEDEKDEHMNELLEEDIEFLLANTGFSLDQIKRWFTEFKLKCPKCQIEYDQFKIYYKSLLPEYLSDTCKDQLIKNLFDLFDIDADGYLNFSEFLVSFWIRFKAPIKEKFTWLFNMFDLDHNGSLNFSEITRALRLCLNEKDLSSLLQVLKKDYNEIFQKNSCEPMEYAENLNDGIESEMEFSAKSTERKINELIVLLDLISKNEYKSENEKNSSSLFNEWSICGRSGFTAFLNKSDDNDSQQFFNKNSASYFNYFADNRSFLAKKIQFTRDRFLFLGEKYKLLRKILLPIKCFYEENSSKK